MFVKRLITKSGKKSLILAGTLKSSDLEPHLVTHYGIPTTSTTLAFDSIQCILAIATRDGRIKLFGGDDAQVLLQSPSRASSKSLQFLENQGILLNLTTQNDIEVWDVDKKELVHIYSCKAVTAFTVLQGSPFMYIGDATGNIFVLKYDQESKQIMRMQYSIPVSATHGVVSKVGRDPFVVYVLPQPSFEFSRVLVIFKTGLLILWGIQESKILAVCGNEQIQQKKYVATTLDGLHNTDYEEGKQISSACWTCLNGSRVAIGYTDGDIWLWNVPTMSKVKSNREAKVLESYDSQSLPISKLHFSTGKDKMPIVSLRWQPGSDKWGHLYVYGGGDFGSNVLRVIRLQETGIAKNQTNLTKLEFSLPGPFIDMSILSSTHTKRREIALLVLTKPGQLYAYDDLEIEKHLLDTECQLPLSSPKPVMIKLPLTYSSVTVAKLVIIPDSIDSSNTLSQLRRVSRKLFPSILPVGIKLPAGEKSPFSKESDGLVKIRTLYITGHSNGTINVWDASSPLMFLLLTIDIKSVAGATLKASSVTAVDFCAASCFLVAGDQFGGVRIFKIAPKPQEIKCLTNTGPAHQGKFLDSSVAIQNIGAFKAHKTAIHCIALDKGLTRVAAGCEEGFVSLIDLKSCTLLSHKRYFTGISSSIKSMQFESSTFPGSGKTVLFVAATDASVIVLDGHTGHCLSPTILRPKNPSNAIFLHVLGIKCTEPNVDIEVGTRDEKLYSPKQSNYNGECNPPETDTSQPLLLLCSENCVWLYFLSGIIKGMKKVYLKYKFQATCCWASMFQSSNYGFGLLLLYTTGKIEIRSLPDLSVLKETTLSICSLCDLQPSMGLISSLSCASDGRLVMIDGDQELFFVSLFAEENDFRLCGSLPCVYNKDMHVSSDSQVACLPHASKKKSIVGALIKEIKGTKSKNSLNIEHQETRSPIGELQLSSIFSTLNFPTAAASSDERPVSDSDDDKLDIDDLELEDHDESFNHQLSRGSDNRNLVSKLRRKLKGKKKLKEAQVMNKLAKESEIEDLNRVRTLEEIKSAYGHTKLRETKAPDIAKAKLLENQIKLQAVSQHTTQMQESAENFSSMAEELLRMVKEKKG